jgi:hypothetical protein
MPHLVFVTEEDNPPSSSADTALHERPDDRCAVGPDRGGAACRGIFCDKCPHEYPSRATAIAVPLIDLKQHWHRKFHNDAKVKWLRGLVATLFTDESDEWRDHA